MHFQSKHRVTDYTDGKLAANFVPTSLMRMRDPLASVIQFFYEKTNREMQNFGNKMANLRTVADRSSVCGQILKIDSHCVSLTKTNGTNTIFNNKNRE